MDNAKRIELDAKRREFEVFSMSSDGFKSAKRYLIQMGEYQDFVNTEPDVNGFSVVNYANELHRKLEVKDDR